jgi:hypothetical protein
MTAYVIPSSKYDVFVRLQVMYLSRKTPDVNQILVYYTMLGRDVIWAAQSGKCM